MDVCGHNLAYELRLFEALKIERTMLLEKIEERQLEVLVDLVVLE